MCRLLARCRRHRKHGREVPSVPARTRKASGYNSLERGHVPAGCPLGTRICGYVPAAGRPAPERLGTAAGPPLTSNPTIGNGEGWWMEVVHLSGASCGYATFSDSYIVHPGRDTDRCSRLDCQLPKLRGGRNGTGSARRYMQCEALACFRREQGRSSHPRRDPAASSGRKGVPVD